MKELLITAACFIPLGIYLMAQLFVTKEINIDYRQGGSVGN